MSMLAKPINTDTSADTSADTSNSTYYLGIETSCDDTAFALYSSSEGKIVASSVVSQGAIHSQYGGVVPEIASRNHILKLQSSFAHVVARAGITPSQIGCIGVTNGPGLVGSIFVGLSYAKGLAYALNIPLYPINHILAHSMVAMLDNPTLRPAFLALVISGGHTHIFYISETYDMHLISRTIDDALGEGFDKVAKGMGGPYPGGPYLESLANTLPSGETPLRFTPPMRGSKDFSFSGLKTAALLAYEKNVHNLHNIDAHVALAFHQCAVASLKEKLTLATSIARSKYGDVSALVVSGGVACNTHIADALVEHGKSLGLNVALPTPYHSTDNGDMIAYTTYLMDKSGTATPVAPLTGEGIMALNAYSSLDGQPKNQN